MGNELVTIIDNTDIKSFQATMKKIEQFQQLIRRNLKEGKDYGTIPGTPKPSLWKPGAEKIVILGKLRSTFEVIDETKDWENEFFQFEIRWNLWSGDNLICQGVGLCSSKEDKYRYRWLTEKKLPKNVNKDNLLYKEKTGKYGTYKVYRVENEDVCSIANTILKMAKKRALIDAALLVGSLSDLFTQDIEDLPEDMISKREAKQEVDRNDEAIEEVEALEKEQGIENDREQEQAEMEFEPASDKQKDYIYGMSECKKCKTKFQGFTCINCGAKDTKDKKWIKILKKGIIHSDYIETADIIDIGAPNKLDIAKASEKMRWWWGDKDKNIIGERERREKNPKKVGTNLDRRLQLVKEVSALMKKNYIHKPLQKKFYKKFQKSDIKELTTEELVTLKGDLEHYVPDWK